MSVCCCFKQEEDGKKDKKVPRLVRVWRAGMWGGAIVKERRVFLTLCELMCVCVWDAIYGIPLLILF